MAKLKFPKIKLKKYKLIEQPPCDFLVLIITTILVIFGIVMIFSASYYSSMNSSGTPFTYLKKQLIFALIGFVLMAILSRLDYHIMQRLMPFIVVVSLLLLVAVISGLGSTGNGATRWIQVGPITIMPGEIAKFAMISFGATWLSYKKDMASTPKGYWGTMILMVIMAFMIVKQPNLSTAITLCVIALGMLFLAGMNKKYIFLTIFLGALAAVGYMKFGGSDYQSNRITSFLNPFADAQGTGYQVVQSLLALGTGGVSGLGLGKSIQKNLYLPEPQNDFILAIIGEELGFIGVCILLILMLALVWKCFTIALRAPDRFGMLFAGGVAIMIGIQVIFNVAVVTSSMPPTGVALPFISYGGNALWICMGSIGVVLNISRHRPQKEKKKRSIDLRNRFIRRGQEK